MSCPVFVGSAFVAQYPTGGGNFWVPLQYLLGLRALGVDAYWLELLWTRGDAARDRQFIDAFRGHVERLDVADRVVLVFFPDCSRDDPPGRAEYFVAAVTTPIGPSGRTSAPPTRRCRSTTSPGNVCGPPCTSRPGRTAPQRRAA